MFVALVHVHVKPEYVDRFVDLIRANHLGSAQEPGCIRFDVAQSIDDPNRFALWEWYADADAAKAHKETPHYLAFKARAPEFMAKERVSDLYTGIYPSSDAGT
jgi:autoinducer 2-degrading protein